MNILDSILRARFRGGFTSEKFMEPGTVYPTANRFARGHRIRVSGKKRHLAGRLSARCAGAGR